MHRREAERVDRPRDEFTHRLGCQQVIASLRLPEAWKVDGEHFELLRQSTPYRRECKDALWPWTQEYDPLAAASTGRVANLQPIDGLPCDVERRLLSNGSIVHGVPDP